MPVRQIMGNAFTVIVSALAVLIYSFITATNAVCAQQVDVAFNAEIPPYVIQEDYAGVEYEIIEEALAIKGHLLVPHFMPPKRIQRSIRSRVVEAGSPFAFNTPTKGVYYAAPHITYRNVVVIPKSWEKQVTCLEDLKNRPLIAFQNALEYLPKSFRTIAATNKNYDEIASQHAQVLSFHARKNRAIVIEERIFRHYTASILPKDRTEYRILRLFPPSLCSVGFINKTLRDDFNEGMRLLRITGMYSKLMRKYRFLYNN